MKIVGIPVYSEPLIPTNANLTGLTTIDFDVNLDDYWNLQRVTHILIRKISDYKVGELKTIQSKTASSISITISVLGDYPRGDAVVYPCVFGIIENHNITNVTDLINEVTIEYREIEN